MATDGIEPPLTWCEVPRLSQGMRECTAITEHSPLITYKERFYQCSELTFIECI